MKCPYCDQEIDDKSTVCPVCGKELTSASDAERAAEFGDGASSESSNAGAGAADAPAEGGTPESPVSDAVTAAEMPVQKSGKKKWTIAAIIAAVVVVAAGAVMLMPKKNPKDVVIDAFKSIVAEGQTNPMDEIFGFKSMSEKFDKESGKVGMSFRVEDISDESSQQIVTGELNFDAANDAENKKMTFGMGIGYADMSLASLDAYLDQKKLAVALPELSGKVFTMNYADDLEGQITKSPYLGQIIAESGVDITGINDYLSKCSEIASSGKQLFNLKELWTRYKEGSKAIDDLKAAMTVEKTDKKDFTVNGGNQSCNGYNVIVTKDALLQFLTTSKEFFLSDETLKQDFVDYLKLAMELQSTMMAAGTEDMTPEELQEKAWQSAEEEINLIMKQLEESLGDVNMVVYVTKDGKMASFDYDTTATIEEEAIRIYGTVTFPGGYSMMSNVNATLNMEDASAQVITFAIDKTGEYESGKSYKSQLTASANIDSDIYSVVLSGGYDVEGKAYNMAADFQSNGVSAVTLTSSGVVNDLVKGESIDVTMDSVKFEVSGGLSDESDYVDFSGTYKMGPLDGEISAPEGEEMDILGATEDDWNTVGTEIMGNAFGLMMGLEQ